MLSSVLRLSSPSVVHPKHLDHQSKKKNNNVNPIFEFCVGIPNRLNHTSGIFPGPVATLLSHFLHSDPGEFAGGM